MRSMGEGKSAVGWRRACQPLCDHADTPGCQRYWWHSWSMLQRKKKFIKMKAELLLRLYYSLNKRKTSTDWAVDHPLRSWPVARGFGALWRRRGHHILHLADVHVGWRGWIRLLWRWPGRQVACTPHLVVSHLLVIQILNINTFTPDFYPTNFFCPLQHWNITGTKYIIFYKQFKKVRGDTPQKQKWNKISGLWNHK